MATDPPVARPFSPLPRAATPSFIQRFFVGVLIVVAIFVVFHPVLTAGLIGSQDRALLIQSQRDNWLMCTRPLDMARELVFPGGAGMATVSPLTRLSYAVDANQSDTPLVQPFQVRLTNLVLHALNAILLFGILQRLSGRLLMSGAAALVFALHPLQVEPVASMARREVLLGGFFTLLMVAAYLRYVRSGRVGWMAPVLGWYLAAAMSSPLYVAAPVVLWLLDIWPLRRAGWRSLVEKAPMLVLLLASLAFSAWSVSRPVSGAAREIGWVDWLSLNVTSVVGRLLWPVNLSPFYPLIGATAVFPIVLTAVLLLLLGFALLRHRPMFVAAAGAIVLIAPALWWTGGSGELLRDAWLYAIWFAPLVCIGAAMQRATPAVERAAPIDAATLARQGSLRRVGLAAVGGLVVICGALAYGQTLIWDNSRDLYGHALKRFPRWAGGYIGLVEACIDESDLDGALRYARQAVDLAPTDPETQFYLGTVLLLHRDHRAADAIAPLRRALESNRNWIACLQNLGVALARTGQTEDAIRFLERARDLNPQSPAIHVGLGHAYLRADRAASARREFQEALRFRSDWVVNLGLAAAWAMNDNIDLARRHLAMAVAQEPSASARAASFDALRRLRDHPGFETLIDTTSPAPATLEGVEWLPSSSTRGHQG